MAQGVAYKCKLKGLVNTNNNQDITLAASDNSYYAGGWVVEAEGGGKDKNMPRRTKHMENAHVYGY